jgi:hypothetical protein
MSCLSGSSMNESMTSCLHASLSACGSNREQAASHIAAMLSQEVTCDAPGVAFQSCDVVLAFK